LHRDQRIQRGNGRKERRLEEKKRDWEEHTVGVTFRKNAVWENWQGGSAIKKTRRKASSSSTSNLNQSTHGNLGYKGAC